MTDQITVIPVIMVDLKKYRIRIHKSTLRSIDALNYILLLVNPEEHILAILRSNRFDPRAHYLTSTSSANNKSVELYSRSLIKSLRNICANWKDNQSYRLYGEIIPSQGLARFYLSEAALMNGDEL